MHTSLFFHFFLIARNGSTLMPAQSCLGMVEAAGNFWYKRCCKVASRVLVCEWLRLPVFPIPILFLLLRPKLWMCVWMDLALHITFKSGTFGRILHMSKQNLVTTSPVISITTLIDTYSGRRSFTKLWAAAIFSFLITLAGNVHVLRKVFRGITVCDCKLLYL